MTMDESSTSFQHADMHGSCVTDLVPEPLRICKQRHQRVSSASSECLPSMTHNEQNICVSSRRASVPKSRTEVDLSRRKSSSSRRSTIGEPLNVRKQRRSDPAPGRSGSSSIGPGRLPGVTLSYPPARPRLRGEHDFTPSIRDLNLHFLKSNPDPQAHRAHERSVTVSSIRDAGLLNTFSSRPLMPLAPALSIPCGQRRAVTLTEPLHNLAELQNLENTLEQEISRRPSVKQRFVSRMVNGLSNKIKVSNGATQPGERLSILHTAMPNILVTSNNPHPIKTRSERISSIGTESILSGDFDTVLAAFPTPPSSNVTSPTTLASSETSRVDWATTLRKPDGVPVVGAELTITPELSKLTSDGGQSMYVVVEIKGVVSPLEIAYEAPLDLPKLDFAVIIDNS